MAIIDAEYQWDRRKLTFFFSVTLPQFYPNQPSPRIDFRTLVRDLYQIYRTRIWMYCVDKDKNRTSRAHNREKFLKQLYKDSLRVQAAAAANLNNHQMAPIGSGIRPLTALSSSDPSKQQPLTRDELNGEERDISAVLGSLHKEGSDVRHSPSVGVEHLAYGMTEMHLAQQPNRQYHQHRSDRSLSVSAGSNNNMPRHQDDSYYDPEVAQHFYIPEPKIVSQHGGPRSNKSAIPSIWGGSDFQPQMRQQQQHRPSNGYESYQYADQQQQQQHPDQQRQYAYRFTGGGGMYGAGI